MRPVAANRLTDASVFLRNGLSFGKETAQQTLTGKVSPHSLIEASLHALQGPEEVDGGRPARSQMRGRRPKALSKADLGLAKMLVHPHQDAHRRHYADGRRSADAQGADGFPDFFDGTAIPVSKLHWQARLVDQAHEAVDTADPLDGARERLLGHDLFLAGFAKRSTFITVDVLGERVKGIE
jgi:hypothetical protein